MASEIMRHFENSPYVRYPSVGKFLITEDSGERRGITLWHNTLVKQPEDPPRFFEEDSVQWLRFGVPKKNKMSQDNYNNLLHDLSIPTQKSPEAYEIGYTLWVKKPEHRIIVERTRLVLESKEQHVRIRRQKLPREENALSVPSYKKLIEDLDDKRIIYAEDFGHWLTYFPFGAKKELKTRINTPRW